MSRGASSVEVVDGSVDGWSWTGEEPDLPALDFDELGVLAGEEPESASAPQPAVRTYDAAGELVVSSKSRSSTGAYAGAMLLIAGLSAFAILMAIRGSRSRRGLP